MMERALAHNTPENMDLLFSDPKFIAAYCGKKRINWYRGVISIFLNETGIDLSNKTIADVGCGTGHALKYIHDNHEHGPLYGFDFSIEALNIARSLVPVANFRLHDLDKPIKEKFDVIIALEVFEHLRQPEIVLKNLRDAINEKGKIFITIPYGPADGSFKKFHLRRWSLDEFKDFIGATLVGRYATNIWAITGG